MKLEETKSFIDVKKGMRYKCFTFILGYAAGLCISIHDNLRGIEMELIQTVIKDLLFTFYEACGFSLAFAICFMFLYLYGKEHGYRQALRNWLNEFKKRKEFRVCFFLAFYISVVLFRTLFNRTLGINPLADVWGGWTLYINGVLTVEPLENIFLFIPLIPLLSLTFPFRIAKKKHFWFTSVSLSFLFSLAIELSQLLFSLGTIQVSDLFYNTLGGLIGAGIVKGCQQIHR